MSNNKSLTKEDLLEALKAQEKRFDKKFGDIEKYMVTKSDLANLKPELKSDLEAQTKEIKVHTDQVAQEIIKAIGEQNTEIIQSIDEMRLNNVTRQEFEALKRKVDRLTTVH